MAIYIYEHLIYNLVVNLDTDTHSSSPSGPHKKRTAAVNSLYMYGVF